MYSHSSEASRSKCLSTLSSLITVPDAASALRAVTYRFTIVLRIAFSSQLKNGFGRNRNVTGRLQFDHNSLLVFDLSGFAPALDKRIASQHEPLSDEGPALKSLPSHRSHVRIAAVYEARLVDRDELDASIKKLVSEK